MFAGMSGADAHVPRLAFSAALTVPMERAGTIIFDKVFVNEGDFYDPITGNHTVLHIPHVSLSMYYPNCLSL